MWKKVLCLATVLLSTAFAGFIRSTESSEEVIQVSITATESPKVPTLHPPVIPSKYCHEKFHNHIHPKNKQKYEENVSNASEEIIVDYRNGKKLNGKDKKQNITNNSSIKSEDRNDKFTNKNDNMKFAKYESDEKYFVDAKAHSDAYKMFRKGKSVFDSPDKYIYNPKYAYDNSKFDSGYSNEHNYNERKHDNYYSKKSFNRESRDFSRPTSEYRTNIGSNGGHVFDVPKEKFTYESDNVKFNKDMHMNVDRFDTSRSERSRQGRSRQLRENSEFHGVVNKSGNGLHLFRVTNAGIGETTF